MKKKNLIGGNMQQKTIIIYDFDGTLTPYSLPQYQVLKDCGYSDEEMLHAVKDIIINEGIDLCGAYMKTIQRILKDNNIEFNEENVCLGADNVTLNKGVIEYFKTFQFKKTGIKHFIITSGLEIYVKNTPVNGFVDDIYGTTLKKENGIYIGADRIVSDQGKVEIIKKIQSENSVESNKIIYFGDGLTDRKAFEYVHAVGGKTVFVSKESKEDKNYQKLCKLGIIDKCFKLDFSENSEIYNYIESIKQ